MADKKVSELTTITGADTASDDFFLIVDTSGSVSKKISRTELNNAIERDIMESIDIDGGAITGVTIDNSVIGGTTAAAGTFTTGTFSSTVTSNASSAYNFKGDSAGDTSYSALRLEAGTTTPIYSDIYSDHNGGQMIVGTGSAHGVLIRVNNNSSGILLDTSSNATFAGRVGLGADSGSSLFPLNISQSSTTLPRATVTGDTSVVGWYMQRTGGTYPIDWYIGVRENTKNLSLFDNTNNTEVLLLESNTGNATFTGGITLSGTRSIISDVTTQNITLSGGNSTSNGANLNMYGGSHATVASDYGFRNGTSWVQYYDASATTHTFTGDVDVTQDVTAEGYNLSAIATDIADTAVDVFVYDTNKDSDGGAWRKRTQNTSWYNETLNTSTRGSRKEFPAVAVIVAETNQVTIYDGDDPDLPMWMVFNSTDGDHLIDASTSRDWSSVYMLNGILCAGMVNDGANGMGLDTANFVADNGYRYRDGTGGATFKGEFPHGIAERSTKTYTGVESRGLIVNGDVNDVAMTVLPNAPLDADTGLPVPTIAVATDGGVSVINNDGTVADSSSTSSFTQVDFEEDNSLWVYRGSTGGTEVITSYASDGFTANNAYTTSSTPAIISSGTVKVISGYRGTGSGLNVIDDDATTQANGMVAYVTSDYNTGWMNGDIKLATLSDTDDTDVTGTELVTNGTFDADTSGWTTDGDSTFTLSSNRGSHTTGTTGVWSHQTITTVVGKVYTFVYDFDLVSGGALLRLGTSVGNADYLNLAVDEIGSVTFTATTTSTSIAVGGGTAGSTATIDNISLRLAEEDRSFNDNGLQVFGTVTKDPVATGAELVAYSGFSASNYLEQPYNSDLDFGTNAFSIAAWFKTSSQSADQYILDRSTDGSPRILLSIRGTAGSDSNVLQFFVADSSGNSSSLVATDFTVTNNIWTNVSAVFDGTTYKLFVNGTQSSVTVTTARDISNDGSPLRIGTRYNSVNPIAGSLALFRISATAPTAAQIAKMYNDEKYLFQDNAAATLYGSSDTVTALAYDDRTELLHVGTSAGRSVFQGLRRVDNTTDAVGAAISASNGLVADD